VTTVHVVVPDGIEDPLRPSGGNVYDRRVCDGLADLGWRVHEHPVGSGMGLAEALGGLPDGALVLVDGLVASGAADAIVPEAGRLRLVVLLHMPLGEGSPRARPQERSVLCAAAAVVTTSRWTQAWLLETYRLPAGRVHVAEPGADVADPAAGTLSGGELLCVGAVTPTKGHDVLLAALARIRDLAWRCVCVGALDIEPHFVDGLRCQAEENGVADRLCFTGPLAGKDLDAAYAGGDVLVSASRAETYGMVITEGLARGLPVIATRVGGVPEALGRADDDGRPGELVPPGDPHALATALRRWLSDPDHRERLRKAARSRRLTLSDWRDTSHRLGRVLSGIT
jgi:glycosyltransferase involved in cell wall biosynthesis